MANVRVHQKQSRGRTFIRIEATPKSAQTRALLQRFKREVGAFHKKWKAAAKRYKAAQARTRRKA